MSDEIVQVKDRATLLSEFAVIAYKRGYALPSSTNTDVLTVQYTVKDFQDFLAELVQRVPKDAFSRSFLPENIAILVGEISEDTINDVIQDLWDIHTSIPRGQHIQILMSSCGGQVYSGLALIGTINELRRQGREVRIHVLGWALSMAFDILESASYRTMEPTAYLMTHEEQYGYEGGTSEQETETKFSRGQELLMLERLAARTGRTVKYYRDKIAHKNWYIGPAEALSEGLIDEVVTVPAFAQTPANPVPARKTRKVAPAKGAESKTQEESHAITQTAEVERVQEEEAVPSC